MNNVFQKKESNQYPRFIKLIIVDLMKKFPNIPKWLEEDYHSIRDDVPLVSIYTTGNVLVRGMLIPDALLTAKIRETDDFKEYEMMFMKVAIPMNQPQLVVSTQGTNRITPSAHSSPQQSLKITIKQKQTVEKDDNDSEDKIEPESHKDNPEVVDDDDREREKHDDEMGSLEIRNEETQTTIPTPLSSPRKILSSDKKTFQELTDFWETHNKIDDILHEVVPQIAENVTNDLIEANLKPCIVNTIIEDCDAFYSERSLQDRADNITLWEALRSKFEKSSTSKTSYREDDFHSHHDEHQDDDAPPEGVKRVKSNKKLKSSKSAKGSSSKHSRKDSTTYNVDKRVPTIFDHARMEATLRDSLSNLSRNAEEYAYHLEQSTSFMENQIVWESRQQDIPRTIPKTLIFYGPQRNPNEPPRPLYNKDLFFLKYGNTEEKKYILSLHKIHAEEFPEPDLEEKLNRWVRKEFKTFNEDARLSIQHWKDSWHKRVYKQNQKKVRKNPEDYYSNHRITEVVRIVTDQPHGLDFIEQILVMRANDKPDSFSEVEFKYLNKNDIEDLYYLCRSNEIDNRKVKLMNSLITFIRSCVIWERVYDFQLGIKGYQVKVNLTAPKLTFPGVEEYAPYTIVDEP
ncbi:hypothetical protein Tco_0436248 [Tanacetum coccineum]